MYILAIESTQKSHSVALYRDGVCVDCVSDVHGNRHVEALVQHIELLLSKAVIGYADLTYIALSVGPGSFSGVRVGIACAKGIALVHSIPIISVTNFEAVLAIAEPMDSSVAVVLDARRKQYYSQCFASDGRPIDEAKLVTDINALTCEVVLLHEESINPSDVEVRRVVSLDARAVAAAAERKIVLGDVDGLVAPLYIRPPDAKPQSSLV